MNSVYLLRMTSKTALLNLLNSRGLLSVDNIPVLLPDFEIVEVGAIETVPAVYDGSGTEITPATRDNRFHFILIASQEKADLLPVGLIDVFTGGYSILRS